ncbi:MAG: energy-coupling factor transporter ATPase [Eubacteriaceae bacterium]|jgi:energy-coupling factor transport system ATP-binding protein|nr:energy-coupling factor transporter ATPase [Eubacteriaceae bacterium]
MSIQVINLEHIYSKGSPFEYKALTNINLTTIKGEFVGLIGHTGSGKSTLIQHFNGLLKPTSGTILYDGIDIFANKKKSLKDLRRKVGLVFQYPEYQLFEETVAKDVAYGPGNLGYDQEKIESLVRESIELVGLDYDEIAEKSPFELSGGQMRRVAIAGVLAMEPEVLILDEPTAGLDPRGRDEILGQIKNLHKKRKMTVILVSHSMEDIGRLVDKIIVMAKGEIVVYDTPAKVFSQVKKLEAIGLAVPEVTYLLHRLKETYPEIRDDIYTMEEAVVEIERVVFKGGQHVH